MTKRLQANEPQGMQEEEEEVVHPLPLLQGQELGHSSAFAESSRIFKKR